MNSAPLLITLLGHGEVEWRSFAFLGTTDPPLSAHGRVQMRAAVEALDNPPITAVASSPLNRCRTFAAALADERRLPFTVERSLAEMRFGEWEGLTSEEVRARHPSLLEKFLADPVAVTPPGGEPYIEFARRVDQALQTLIRRQQAHTLVVTHAGVIRVALALCIGVPASHLCRIAMPMAATCRLMLRDGLPPCLLGLNFAAKGV